MGQIRSVYSGGYGIWWEFKYSNIIEVVCNLILNFILGYFFGMKGIVFATIITVLIFGVIISDIIALKTCFKKSSGEFLLITFIYIILTIICGIITYFLCSRIIIENLILTLVVRLGICILIPSLFFLIISMVNKKHRDYIIFFKNNYLLRKR